MTEKHKIGRPSIYTPKLAELICVRLGLGESLAKICKDPDMPNQSTVYNWLARDPDFLEKYTRAREEQAETHADAIVDIADETPETNPVLDADGNVLSVRLDSGYVAWQKQRIEARKWTAMKLKPKKYGDKVVVGGDAENPIKSEVKLDIFQSVLDHMLLKRQSENLKD